MKKISFLFIFITSFSFGQSITLLPNGYSNNLVKTPTNNGGFEHTDGIVRLNTYVNSASVSLLGGWLQTFTAHPLIFSTANGNPQMYLNNNGNIILTPSDGKTGNVGIGLTKTATPAEKLVVNGNIRSTNLTGTGKRNVYADANGTLATSNEFIITISPNSFQPAKNDNTLGTFITGVGFGACYMSAGSFTQLFAGLNIPNNATITSATVYYINTDNTKKFSIQLGQNTLLDNGGDYILRGSTLVVSSSNIDIKSFVLPDINNANSQIDNSINSFYISISVITNSGSLTSWSNNMSIKGVKITYTY